MADNQIIRRAKAHFPTVLLTLLSIVQALALELMWAYLGEAPYLYNWSFLAILGWLQLAATLLGILLIWLIYSGLVMRFIWMPTTTDAVFPFIVGILEFTQISTLGPASIGLWFVMLGVLFAAMSWVSQASMKRARMDEENRDFFSTVSPATWRDHINSIIPTAVLLLVGAVLWITNNQGWMALIAIVGAIALLCWQLWMNHVFMQRSFNQGERTSHPPE